MILMATIPAGIPLWVFRREKVKRVHTQGDIQYIGGAEVLPPPLELERETQVIGALGTESEEEAKSILIEHNLRLVVYIARNLTIPAWGGRPDLHRHHRTDQVYQYVQTGQKHQIGHLCVQMY